MADHTSRLRRRLLSETIIVIALISASGCRPQIVRELTVEAVNHAKLINGQYVIKVSSQLMSDELI